jgi:hypothetical protein
MLIVEVMCENELVLILFKQSGLFLSDHAVALILGHCVGCLTGTNGLDKHSRINIV